LEIKDWRLEMNVKRETSNVKRQTSGVKGLSSFVIRRLSFVIRHSSFVRGSEIQEFITVGVDNQGAAAHRLANGAIVIEMGVTVKQVAGTIAVNKPHKGLETRVGQIFPIMDFVGRRMRHEHVEKAALFETA
jgi:hypothetical protein